MATTERLRSADGAGSGSRTLPFDRALLDRLLDEAGIDVLLVTAKHNVHYLLGGYRFFFFDQFDAIGVSRYLPILVYPRGAPDKAIYIGHPMEAYERENNAFWMELVPRGRTAPESMQVAVDHLKKLGLTKRIGVERAFLPAEAEVQLRTALPGAEIVEAKFPLERLRARKSKEELAYLKRGSELVVDSMLAVMSKYGPGSTKRELTEALRREEVNRGLHFDYCLITCGTSLNRAPTDQVWGAGDILSLDSGGNYKGYIGDLCRMAIHGEPDHELKDLLAEVDEIQLTSRKPIRPGAKGGEIYAAVDGLVSRSRHGNSLEFVAHGMGLISHEAPRLTSKGPVPYPDYDAGLPLEEGMVISIETTILHPKRGFVKLEDTVAVTADGWEAYGDTGRGWNRGGTAA